MKLRNSLPAMILCLAGVPAAASVILVNEDFSTDTRSNYTDLGVHFGPVNTTSGLSAGAAYDLDYISQIASVEAYGFGGGSLTRSSVFSGTNFSSTFGTTSGGAFGLVGFDTENAQVDNLLVQDMDATASVALPPTPLSLLGIRLAVQRKQS